MNLEALLQIDRCLAGVEPGARGRDKSPMTGMTVVVTSDIHRDELFAEIRSGSVIWAEVAYKPESREMIVRILPNPFGGPYEFELLEAQKALDQARRRLSDIGPPGDD